MDIRRQELLPGVFLNCLETNSSCIAVSINLLSQLDRDTASENAVIPHILCHATKAYPSPEALAGMLASHGSMKLKPAVRRFGEVHSSGIYCEIPDVSYLREGFSLVGQVLTTPYTKGGLFLPHVVTSVIDELTENENLTGLTQASPLRICSDQMCCYEDYSINEQGDTDTIRSISYLKISKYYKDYIRSCPVEIVVTGPVSPKQAAKLLKDSLCTLPRGELNDDIGTDIRMNALEDEPRRVETELSDFPEATIHGYRIGEWMDDPDVAALEVFAQLTGAEYDLSKGVLFLSSNSLALAEPPLISSLQQKCVSDEELSNARQAVYSRFQELVHQPEALDRFILEQLLNGLDYTPDVVAELAQEVTADDLAQLADSLACDMILQNLHPEEDSDDDTN